MKFAVEIAGVAVALIGVVVAGYFGWRALSPAKRSEQRDDERLAREREEVERGRQADLVVELVDSRHYGPGVRKLTLTVRNIGRATARGIYLSLIDGDGEAVGLSEYFADEHDFFTLGAGETSAPLTRMVEYVNDPSGRVALPIGLASQVIWHDDRNSPQQGRRALVVNLDDVT